MRWILRIVILLALIVMAVFGFIWLNNDKLSNALQKTFPKNVAESAEIKIFPEPKILIPSYNVSPNLRAKDIEIPIGFKDIISGEYTSNKIHVGTLNAEVETSKLDQILDTKKSFSNRLAGKDITIDKLNLSVDKNNYDIKRVIAGITKGKINADYFYEGSNYRVNISEYLSDRPNVNVSSDNGDSINFTSLIRGGKLDKIEFACGDKVSDIEGKLDLSKGFINIKSKQISINSEEGFLHKNKLISKIIDELDKRIISNKIEVNYTIEQFLYDNEKLGSFKVGISLDRQNKKLNYIKLDNFAFNAIAKSINYGSGTSKGEVLIKIPDFASFINNILFKHKDIAKFLPKKLFEAELGLNQKVGVRTLFDYKNKILDLYDFNLITSKEKVSTKLKMDFNAEKVKVDGSVVLSSVDLTNTLDFANFFGAQNSEYKEYQIFNFFRNLDNYSNDFNLNFKIGKIYFQTELVEDFSMDLNSYKGLITLKDINYRIIDDIFKASLSVNLNNFLPHVKFNFKFPRINLRTAMLILNLIDPTKEDKYKDLYLWSTEKIDFEFLKTFTMDAKIQAGELIVGDTSLDAFTTKLSMANEKLDIQNFSGMLFGQRILVNGYLLKQGFPTIDLAFSIQNANVLKYLNNLYGFNRIDGNMSVNGKLNLVGNSAKNLVDSLTGSIDIIARKVRASGFNFKTLDRQVRKSIKRTQIPQIAKYALSTGIQAYDYIAGKIVISQGKAHIKDWKFGDNGHSATLSGKLDLTQKIMSIKYEVDLFNINTPLSLIISGPTDFPTMDWVTKGLYDYWDRLFYQEYKNDSLLDNEIRIRGRDNRGY